MPRTYNRAAAGRYAHRHWDSPNPAYANMDAMGGGGDCTNFTSQCLYAGGWPLDFRENTWTGEWWYRRVGDDAFDAHGDDQWSCTWSLPENQFRYLSANHGEALDLLTDPTRARRLQVGDIVYYEWGNGHFGHGALVTGFDGRDEPLVTYRTLRPRRPQKDVPWRLPFRGPAVRIYAVRLTDRPRTFPAAPNGSRLVPCDRRRLPRGRQLAVFYPLLAEV